MVYLKTLTRGSTVHACFLIDGELRELPGKVLAVNGNADQQPYESLRVKWEETEDTSRISPWELVLPKEDKGHPGANRVALNKLISPVKQAIELAIANTTFAAFVSLRGTARRLLEQAERPMDLTLLRKRINNQWYQTSDELIADVRRFASNAPALGLPQETANALVWTLLAAIRQGIQDSQLVPFVSSCAPIG
jgi:hypothetical protein